MPVRFRQDISRWGYQFSRNGTRYTAFQWDTKRQAAQAEREAHLKLEQGEEPHPKRINLATALTFYLIHHAKTRSAQAAKNLYYNFKKTIVPFFGGETLIADITEARIEEFIGEQKKRAQKKEITLNTLTHYLAYLSAFFSFCRKKRKWIYHNPFANLDRSGTHPRRYRKSIPTHEEISAAENTLQGIDYYFFRFLKFTGARLDEANRITWDRVRWSVDEIHLPGTKTWASERTVPMCRNLKDDLLALKDSPRTSEALLFPGKRKQQIYNRKPLFRKIFKKTGIKITAKNMRDYFSDTVYGWSKDVRVVKDLLGHTNIQTTDKYLTNLRARHHGAVKVFDNLKTVKRKPECTGNAP